MDDTMKFGEHTKTFHVIEQEDYQAGDIIFDEGTSGDWVYVIMKGEVEIYKNVRGKRIVIDKLLEGDLFGELSFIDKKPRSAGARALTDVTVGLFDRNYLIEQYNKLPNNFRVIFSALAKRLRKMTAVAANLASKK
jgi:CRP/FNR family transcriptional regulator, cyclic AMP receptor protein